jgi:exosortase C (VPDSG-CTERM-specific)
LNEGAKGQAAVAAAEISDDANAPERLQSRRLMGFVMGVAVLALAFNASISDWWRFTGESELYAYARLIPAMCLYLVWIGRKQVVLTPVNRKDLITGAVLLSFGVGLLMLGYSAAPLQDRLARLISSFAALVLALAAVCFGAGALRPLWLPGALLFFSAPLPQAFELGLESFLQRASADSASALFALTGVPMVRQGMFLHLPGIILEVARECSGIRSTLILFISSLVAGYLFLNSPGHRMILAALVVPLGILRNGFRILTIGILCVHVDPAMINSWVHKQGGPLFFALSLIPFAMVLLLLWRRERSREQARAGAGLTAV